jgi:hypothetical protein
MRSFTYLLAFVAVAGTSVIPAIAAPVGAGVGNIHAEETREEVDHLRRRLVAMQRSRYITVSTEPHGRSN